MLTIFASISSTSLTLYSPVVTIHPVTFNFENSAFFSQSIYLFHKNLTIISTHQMVFWVKALCSLWGMKWI